MSAMVTNYFTDAEQGLIGNDVDALDTRALVVELDILNANLNFMAELTFGPLKGPVA